MLHDVSVLQEKRIHNERAQQQEKAGIACRVAMAGILADKRTAITKRDPDIEQLMCVESDIECY